MRHALQLAVLVAALVASVASSSPKQSQVQPVTPSPPGAAARVGDVYFCHGEKSPTAAASMCRPTFDACESERAAAGAEGLEVTPCAATQRVACFQLGGDPAAANTWCATSIEDCETWRRLDARKNPGSPSGACAWR